MINDAFLYVAMALFASSGASYLVATLRGRTRPHRVTWFLWALIPGVIFAAQASEGVGAQRWATFVIGLMPALVFLASFRAQAEWHVTRFDAACGALSLAGLAWWLLTEEGLVAICLAIAADMLAGIPTLRKSYAAPHTEHAPAYLLGGAGALLALLTLDAWTLAGAGFLTWILLSSVLNAAFITTRVGDRGSATAGAPARRRDQPV